MIDNCQDCTKCSGNQVKSTPSVPPITSIMLIVTENCNMACRYCFVHQKPINMSLEVAMNAVKWLVEQPNVSGRPYSVNFFGGEPTILWDEIIVPVTTWVREVYKKPFTLGMTTNGTLLTPDRLAYMDKNQIGLLFSIDGDKEIQDRNRPMRNGKSSFDILEPLIPEILRYYPNMTFRATMGRDGAKDMLAIHKFAVAKGYKHVFCTPNGHAIWTDDEINVLVNSMREVADYWIELFRSGVSVGFDPLGRAVSEVTQYNRCLESNIHRNRQSSSKCGVGGTSFASVDWKGNIYSCQEMVGNMDGKADEFHIGNIYTGVNDTKRLQMISEYNIQNVQSSKPNRCEACVRNRICDGGCVVANLMATGNTHHMSEVMCVYYETAIKEMTRVLNILGEEKNETAKQYFAKSLQKGR